jgi:DNA modification methylase
MINETDYINFLKAKVKMAPKDGFSIDLDEINPNIKPHNKIMVKWLVEGGRRACFASFGLHKTVTQLEAVRCTLVKAGGGKGLIVCPLNVKQEFIEDAKNILKWDNPPVFIHRNSEITRDGIYITNYESVRDGRLDPREFKVASLDEAAILRGLGGTKTFREFMRLFTGDAGPMGQRRGEDQIKYRFVATAVPSPNEFTELLSYADFLGIMDVSQAKTRFFKRDSTHADKLTLFPHKEDEFWMWVSSWALFITQPSDITGKPEDDNGYVLPELDIRWHELPVDHSKAGVDKDRQIKMFKDASLGLQDAAKEKRDSLPDRIKKMMELRAEDPEAHRILWHDLESERHEIERSIPGITSIYGSQDYEKREDAILDFSYGRITELAAKPVIAGSGCNFQRHCSWAIYLGIGFKFNDFIQSIHRIQRFLQENTVRIDLIYTESERNIRKVLETKWFNHKKLVSKMTELIRKYGLSHQEMSKALTRKIGVERVVIEGNRFKIVCNDNVIELNNPDFIKDNSIGLILTSIPFSTQYEYSPNYSDFGHSESNAEFFKQMDFLTPNLLRVLKPGRIAAIHVKDRIVPMGLSGMGCQTVYPFHADCISHYTKHGFAFMGMKTIVTDVVRENNQTYRLGWTEQCKDGSKMGVGMPEYLLLFRKPASDLTNAYADDPVIKHKTSIVKCENCNKSTDFRGWGIEDEGRAINGNEKWICPCCGHSQMLTKNNFIRDYSRARWQMDAHGFARSSGNRCLKPDELAKLECDAIFKEYKRFSLETIYDFEYNVKIAETLEAHGKLPSGFMLLQPQSWSEDVWTDITRMLTLNGSQWSKGKEMHLCLAKGSLILTKQGYRPIEEINYGDLVLTHKGNWKPVIGKLCTGVRSVIKTKAQGVAELITTPDHKLWVRKNDQARPKDYLPKTNPDWIEAQNCQGGWVNLKLPQIEDSNLSAQEWWIVGRYLADGHTGTRGDFFISVGKSKQKEFEEIAAGMFGFHQELDALQYRLKNLSEDLKEMLRKCGRGAINKQVPIEGLCLDIEKSEALLNGYLSGDGCKIGNAVTASSISKALLLGMAMVAQRAWGVIASVYKSKKPGKHIIQGRTVNQNQLWVMSWRNSEQRQFGEIYEDGAWKKIFEPEPTENIETWNIQVADDASYTAEGCIVKNCPMQFDIADRVIEQMSNPGDIVLDPFGGLMTIPYRAIPKGRYGMGVELNHSYFLDGAPYCRAAESEVTMPSLFDVEKINEAV